jgi:type VI protein secretion system component VasK
MFTKGETVTPQEFVRLVMQLNRDMAERQHCTRQMKQRPNLTAADIAYFERIDSRIEHEIEMLVRNLLSNPALT